MLRALVNSAGRLLNDLHRSFIANGAPAPIPQPQSEPLIEFSRLQRVWLTDEVNRTILKEFAEHRKSFRGQEEIGWLLLGVREEKEATVLATLPAGAKRDAGVAHVHFNSNGQALASRIIRRWDPRLKVLGVFHTHPGSLRHPSQGDYRGDSQWVGQLRGREGIFGIGTADAGSNNNGTPISHQPQKHRQCMGELCLSWYSLHENDSNYKPLEVDLTLGPDVALPLRPVWPLIEKHADALERLCLQQKKIHFRIAGKTNLVVDLGLADAKEKLSLLLNEEGVRYYVVRGEDLREIDPEESRLDRAVYLILAELAN